MDSNSNHSSTCPNVWSIPGIRNQCKSRLSSTQAFFSRLPWLRLWSTEMRRCWDEGTAGKHNFNYQMRLWCSHVVISWLGTREAPAPPAPSRSSQPPVPRSSQINQYNYNQAALVLIPFLAPFTHVRPILGRKDAFPWAGLFLKVFSVASKGWSFRGSITFDVLIDVHRILIWISRVLLTIHILLGCFTRVVPSACSFCTSQEFSCHFRFPVFEGLHALSCSVLSHWDKKVTWHAILDILAGLFCFVSADSFRCSTIRCLLASNKNFKGRTRVPGPPDSALIVHSEVRAWSFVSHCAFDLWKVNCHNVFSLLTTVSLPGVQVTLPRM